MWKFDCDCRYCAGSRREFYDGIAALAAVLVICGVLVLVMILWR